MPTALVTGGAGFIGSHLTEHLVERDWSVRVLDDLSAGKRENLKGVETKIEFLEGSILDPVAVRRAVSGADFVFHLAALVSVPQSVAQPRPFNDVCATGTLEVLTACQEAKVKRLVYTGSSSAYGNCETCPITEDAPLNALSPYAAGKLAGEHYCTSFAETSDLETVRLRNFNVYGPRQDPSSPYSGVISIFITKLLANHAPTIFGDGLQTRDFVYVADVARANYLAATAENVSGKVFNVGGGGSLTLLELVESLNKHLGTSVTPQFAAPRAGDVRHSQADVSAARQYLGYEPAVSFDEGIARCLEHYRAV